MVDLKLLVAADGTVSNRKILQSSDLRGLDGASLVAARRGTFRPAIEKDWPVQSWTQARYTWSVEKQTAAVTYQPARL